MCVYLKMKRYSWCRKVNGINLYINLGKMKRITENVQHSQSKWHIMIKSQLILCSHLSWCRLHSVKQVRYSSGEGPGSPHEVRSTTHLILHQSRQQLHTFWHLRQIRGDGGDCTAYRCIIRVCRVPWEIEQQNSVKSLYFRWNLKLLILHLTNLIHF